MLPSQVRPCPLEKNNVLGILRISTVYFRTYCLQGCNVFLVAGTAFFFYFDGPQAPNIYIDFDKLVSLKGVHLRKPTPLTHSLTYSNIPPYYGKLSSL